MTQAQEKRGEKILAWFIRGEYFSAWDHDNRSFGGGAIILTDPDRLDRIMAAAEDGGEGSTNVEIIQDWRDAWDCFVRDYKNPIDRIDEAVRIAIDTVEAWHEDHGTLHKEVG